MTIEERAPGGAFDADMWAGIQQIAVKQVEYDADSPNTIQGFSPETRMLLGLHEERAEVLSDDKLVSSREGYRRFDALVKGAAYITKFSSDPAGVREIVNHQGELGDSAWYLANYTNTLDIDMGVAVRDYTAAPFLRLTTPARHPAEYPPALVLFKDASSQLLKAAGEIIDRSNPEVDDSTRAVVTHAAGAYAVAMGLLLRSTFGARFPEVMERTYEKIDDRKARGVLMVGHGDNR